MKDQLNALVMRMHASNISYAEAVKDFKKSFIVHVLDLCKGNQCKAAGKLRMHRNTLSRAILDLEIDVRAVRAGARRPPASARPLLVEKRFVK